jgi:ubiquinone/menaquinone biosynthesis C-methylase UbiE
MKTALFEKAIGLLKLVKGVDYHVLDFGCGKGELLGRLAKSVGANSRLVGYDAMEPAIAGARARYPNVEFICDRFVRDLPFADASFDFVVTIDTLECLTDKEALINEMHRIVKPGGHVLAMHWDWDTQLYHIPSRALARQAAWAFSDWKQPWMDAADGQMGRQLWGLVERSGKFHGTADSFCLIETSYEAGTYGYDRAQDLAAVVEAGGFEKGHYEQFCRELSESYQRGDYFYSLTSFIYYGQRI